MFNTTRMTVIDDNGEEREVELLLTFDAPDGRQFALFTSSTDEDGDVYPYQYDEDGNMEYVTNEEDRKMCEEVLGAFTRDEENENEG